MTEDQKINSFQNKLKEPTSINFSITTKRDLESPNIQRFHNSIPKTMLQVNVKTSDHTEVDDMVLAMVMDVVDE